MLQLEQENFCILRTEDWTLMQYRPDKFSKETIGVYVNPTRDVFEFEKTGSQLFTCEAAIRETGKVGKRIPTDAEFQTILTGNPDTYTSEERKRFIPKYPIFKDVEPLGFIHMGYEKVISPMFFYGSAAYFLSSTLEEKKSLDAPFSGFWAYGIHENAPESIARITVEKPVAGSIRCILDKETE